MTDLLHFPLGVVAHDAGAANHIIAWLGGIDSTLVNICLEGPAARLWGQSFESCYWPNLPLSEVISRSNMLITGTGWESTLEHDARKLANLEGLKSVAVIDHWANYRERFVRSGQQVLPDEIWVSDEYAENLVKCSLPNIKIVKLPNVYLNTLVEEVKGCELELAKGAECNVLYVLEPIRETWRNCGQPGEFQALDFFVKNAKFLCPERNLTIRLRPHPSDPPGKYERWLRAQTSVLIALDESHSLAESIAWSDLVVGCHTYAMVVALGAGRRVISSVPPWAPPCTLPQAGILKLRDLGE